MSLPINTNQLSPPTQALLDEHGQPGQPAAGVHCIDLVQEQELFPSEDPNIVRSPWWEYTEARHPFSHPNLAGCLPAANPLYLPSMTLTDTVYDCQGMHGAYCSPSDGVWTDSLPRALYVKIGEVVAPLPHSSSREMSHTAYQIPGFGKTHLMGEWDNGASIINAGDGGYGWRYATWSYACYDDLGRLPLELMSMSDIIQES